MFAVLEEHVASVMLVRFEFSSLFAPLTCGDVVKAWCYFMSFSLFSLNATVGRHVMISFLIYIVLNDGK